MTLRIKVNIFVNNTKELIFVMEVHCVIFYVGAECSTTLSMWFALERVSNVLQLGTGYRFDSF